MASNDINEVVNEYLHLILKYFLKRIPDFNESMPKLLKEYRTSISIIIS